jgi:hypothetical protein
MDMKEAIARTCAMRPGEIDDDIGLPVLVLDQTEGFDEGPRWQDRELWEREFLAMSKVFDDRVRELAIHLGQPDYLGAPQPWQDFPGIVGETIARWRHHAPPLYASLFAPDTDLPISVFLAKVPEPR